MDNEKNLGADKGLAQDQEGSAPRARNRTVMLTPEMTGQVRARLAQDMAPASGASSDGFMPLSSRQRMLPDATPNSNIQRPLTPLEASRTADVHENVAPPMQQHAAPVSHAAPQATSGLIRAGVPLASLAAAHAAHAPNNPSQHTDSGKAQVIYAKKTKVVGFLVSYDENENGDVFELRIGRVIVTSEISGTGNFFVVHDSTVSPMHAILRVGQNGEVQVLDQLSEHGTRIKRFGSEEEIELSGEKGNIEHGDTVSFGKRKFNVCMIQGLTE